MKYNSGLLLLLCLAVVSCSSFDTPMYATIESTSLVLSPTWAPSATPSLASSTQTSTCTPAETAYFPIKGCRPRFISRDVVMYGVPSLSSDGEWLAFACSTNDEYFLCNMRIDGTELQQIVSLGSWFPYPVWSPIDNVIAISKRTSVDNSGSSIWDLYLISPDGTVIRKLTDNPAQAGAILSNIQWSPDGQWIAFVAPGHIGAERSSVYIIRADGSGLQQLTYPPSFDTSPRWSPDGTRLAYLAESPSVRYLVIETESWDSRAKQQYPLEISGDLSWSPDGIGIIYISDRSNNFDLYFFDLIQNEETRLTFDPGVDIDPVWSPDGSMILFRSNRSGRYELYTMHGPGNEIVRQVENATFDFLMNPFWSRDGDSIYFFLANNLKDLYELWVVDTMEACEEF